MAAHALQDAVGTGLHRRMEVRGEVAWSLDEQPGERVVDFRRLDARETKPDGRHGVDQGLDQLSERTHDARRTTHVRSVRSDMHAREHNLRMVLRKRLRFLYELGHG